MEKKAPKPPKPQGRVVTTVAHVDVAQTDWRAKHYVRVDLADGAHLYVPKAHPLAVAVRGNTVTIALT